jgi:putative transposase
VARIARAVVAGVAHHVTQRGNRRGDVFFSDEDRREFFRLFHRCATHHDTEVLACWLMTNHVHLVMVLNGPSSTG